MPEHSFHYKGKQFPVCARCTGAFIGYFMGGLIYPFFIIPLWLAFIFCFFMFSDWLMQRINWIESTNIRRLITGILCGFALMQMYIEAIVFVIKQLFNC